MAILDDILRIAFEKLVKTQICMSLSKILTSKNNCWV